MPGQGPNAPSSHHKKHIADGFILSDAGEGTRVGETVVRHWRWLSLLVIVTLASALLSGLVFSGWPSVLVSLLGGVVSFAVGVAAIMRVREIERFKLR